MKERNFVREKYYGDATIVITLAKNHNRTINDTEKFFLTVLLYFYATTKDCDN